LGFNSFAGGIVFALPARAAPRVAAPMTLGEGFRLLRKPMAWVLSLFYFQTFGGFVALGIALPTLLRDVFKLTVEDAGLRAAGFVVLATLCRPLGGWIADRWGGERLLRVVFVGLIACAWFMVFRHIVPFTVGALGGAALLGLGNGGVFKLVPRHFPQQTGAASGLVGAAGGLGGFFPPIVLGLFRDHTGSYAPGFMLLSVFAAGCASVVWRAAAFRQASTALSQGQEVAPIRAAE
jgi:NNP family nitrate/nitrite transporter-like MFS transporter